jgi:hypothetical protein
MAEKHPREKANRKTPVETRAVPNKCQTDEIDRIDKIDGHQWRPSKGAKVRNPGSLAKFILEGSDSKHKKGLRMCS